MGDTHDFRDATESASRPTQRHQSLPLAILFACIAAWAVPVSTVPPKTLQYSLITAGVVLALIFGWRRSKRTFDRVEGAIAFFTGAFFFAHYSELVARVIQGSFLGGHSWHALDAVLEVVAVAAGAPIALFVVYIMWLSWSTLGTKAS